jgi:hypothetical protein
LIWDSIEVFEFCSGLVDLVVCVGHHGGRRHRLALSGEGFVGLVAEHVAEVVGAVTAALVVIAGSRRAKPMERQAIWEGAPKATAELIR